VRGSPEILAHVGVVGAEGRAGEGPEEWRRLELELSASSTWTRQSSWHGQLGWGKAGGAGSMVRLTANVTLVLRRHIAAAQLDARMRPLSRQRWCTRTAADGTGDMATCYQPSVHREVGMATAEWGEAARRSKRTWLR
jgi:hypothetical protein